MSVQQVIVELLVYRPLKAQGLGGKRDLNTLVKFEHQHRNGHIVHDFGCRVGTIGWTQQVRLPSRPSGAHEGHGARSYLVAELQSISARVDLQPTRRGLLVPSEQVEGGFGALPYANPRTLPDISRKLLMQP